MIARHRTFPQESWEQSPWQACLLLYLNRFLADSGDVIQTTWNGEKMVHRDTEGDVSVRLRVMYLNKPDLKLLVEKIELAEASRQSFSTTTYCPQSMSISSYAIA